MRIGILGGTGREGRGLATRLARAGAEITIGSRDSERANEMADRLRGSHPGSTIRGASNQGAVESADVVLLAVPYSGVETTLASVSGALRPDTLVVDVTVPVVFAGGAPSFVEPPDGSAGEFVRRLLPERVAVACAFKTLPASLLEQADPLACDDFVCGDSKVSRERVMALVASIPSLRPVDAGPLESARIIERLTLLAIRLNRRYKTHDARFQVVGIAP